jgi:hypothetical protein
VTGKILGVVERALRCLAPGAPERRRTGSDGTEPRRREACEIDRAVASHRDAADRDATGVGVEPSQRVRDHPTQHVGAPAPATAVVPVARAVVVRNDDARRAPAEALQRSDEVAVDDVARIRAAAVEKHEQRRFAHARKRDLLVSGNAVADAVLATAAPRENEDADRDRCDAQPIFTAVRRQRSLAALHYARSSKTHTLQERHWTRARSAHVRCSSRKVRSTFREL